MWSNYRIANKMTDSFEKWIAKNKGEFSEDVVGLFFDSLRCYKNEILRPAYLLAYQGMMLAIRNKIIRGSKPDGFNDIEWERKIKTLELNPDINSTPWDEATITLVKMTANPPKAAPLHIPSHVRNQFEYWRILRNACAHYKKESLIKANVLSLYNFIGQWLLRISVSGGLEEMLDKIRDYCDPAKTPESVQLKELLNDVHILVREEEMEEFVRNTLKIFGDSKKRRPEKAIYDLLTFDGDGHEALVKSTVDVIRSKEELRDKVIMYFPEMVLLLLKDGEVREFWYGNIQELRWHGFLPLKYLLRACKIPAEEHHELFAKMQQSQFERGSYLPSDDEETLETLKQFGYFQQFMDEYVTEDYLDNSYRFREICGKVDFYTSHFFGMPMTKNNIEKLVELLPQKDGSPYLVFDRFVEKVLGDESFRKGIKEAAVKYQIELPAAWGC